jgi:hypothetical protein
MFGMVQSDVTPIVAVVCDPGVPRTAGLKEVSHNAGPIAARAKKPECDPKTAVFELCPMLLLHAVRSSDESIRTVPNGSNFPRSATGT